MVALVRQAFRHVAALDDGVIWGLLGVVGTWASRLLFPHLPGPARPALVRLRLY